MALRLTATETKIINVYEHGSLSGQFKTTRMKAAALVQELRELVGEEPTDSIMTPQELTQIADLIEQLIKE